MNSTNKVVNFGCGNNRNKETLKIGWDTNGNLSVAGWKKVGNGGWGNNYYTQREPSGWDVIVNKRDASTNKVSNGGCGNNTNKQTAIIRRDTNVNKPIVNWGVGVITITQSQHMDGGIIIKR